MTSKQIRQQFLDFFESKKHTIVESSPVVPHDDPTLMFTNAGMNQFKDVFLGTGSRSYTRAADTQKCIRAGGKHNDLDDVGQDTYHHTFFEMLGNWSFGDYFKKEAIEWAWELLTEVWGFEKDRLHATYFEGSEAEGLEPDTETAELWKTVTDIDPTHIHPGNKKDNFWEMGDVGPCGPCSEIHVDLTPDKSGASLVNAGDARVIELWNLVFIQFNRDAKGILTPLPAKHVDTGMGFERLCGMLKGMQSGDIGSMTNYDTDVFGPIFDAIRKRTGAPAYTGTLPGEAEEGTKGLRDEGTEGRGDAGNSLRPSVPSSLSPDQIMVDVSYRVIADHVRCLTFALTDGAIPSNEGRGYVLRRILRRAVRYARQYMNMHEPFLCDLVGPLCEHMADAFPELHNSHTYGKRNVERVAELIRDEEASFLKTLERGIKLFDREADFRLQFAKDEANEAVYDLGYKNTPYRPMIHGVIPGGVAFVLHDTYGFPLDLTVLMAQERGMTVDIEEFGRLMEVAREKSRGQVSGAFPLLISGTLWSQEKPQTTFAGFDTLTLDARILGTVRTSPDTSDGSPIYAGQEGMLVLDTTSFYAEKGGQVGDIGRILSPSGEFQVEDTREIEGVTAHIGRCIEGEIHQFSELALNEPLPTPSTEQNKKDPQNAIRSERGRRESVSAIVSAKHRNPIMKNHTATHLLNWALREVLGDHVQQKGSLVDPEKTRFDFSHNKPVDEEQLTRIQELVREQAGIEQGSSEQKVYTKEVDQKAALKINTLRAVFGEKYPDIVRVVSIGADIDEMLSDPTNAKWMKYSVEFCGGTHVKNISEIGAFVLTHEEGVAKGVRRVVGISGEAARNAIELGEKLLAESRAIVVESSDSPDSEPQASACADSRKSQTSSSAEAPRGLKPAAQLSSQLSAFQQKINEATIPILVRHKLQTRIAELQKLVKEQQKQTASASGEAVMESISKLFESAETVDGVKIVVGEVPSAPTEKLRGAIDWVRNKTDASAVLLASVTGDRVTLIAGMSKAVVAKGVKAGDLIKEIAPLVGGKGGGRPDMAQGGGADASGVPGAVTKAVEWLTGRLG